jgi:hypothetical protein
MGAYDKCKAADCHKHEDWIVVEYRKRITSLEREKQMYINSTDRLTAQVKELEAELVQCRKDLSAATVDEVKFRNKWADATADNARLRGSLKRLEWWNEKPGTGQDGRTNIYHRLFNLAKVAKRWQLLQPRKWSMTLGAVGLCPYCRRRIYTPFIDHFDRCQEFARALVSGERQ